MSKLARNRAEAVYLYVEGKFSLRLLADRYGATVEGVRQLLINAGVEMRGRGKDVASRKASWSGAPKPPATAIAKPSRRSGVIRVTLPDGDDQLTIANRKHVAAVLRINGGRGFPFGTMGGAR